MDTKKLRQKILDLAIHGKLVPQDPNDEPASVLLERIRAEKEQLIKEGKIKAPKKSKSAGDTSHYPKDVPFEVPQGWVLSTVFEVFQINPKNHVDDSTEAGFVPMTNISDGFEDKYSYEVKPWESIKSGFTHFRNGDIAVAKISPCLENRKSFVVRGLPQGIGAGTTELFVFRSGQIIPEYGLLFFKSEFFISNCVGIFNGVVGQQRVARTIIEEMPFPIPPIAEQIKIVQCVNSIFSMISEVENNQSALKSSIEKSKALILDLAIHGKLVPQDPTDDPAYDLLKRIKPDFQPSDNLHYEGELPNGWCFSTIGDLFQHNTGKALNGKDQVGEELRYITTSNLYWDRFDLNEVRTMPFTEAEKEKCRATKGDLLVCEGGDIGRAAIWPYDFDVMIQNHIHRLRPREDISIRFYYYIFLLYKQMGLIGGKGIAILGLSSRELDKMVVPVPPVPEQHRIVTVIENLFAQMDALISNLS
jgi:type I restriction enzyme S subunit